MLLEHLRNKSRSIGKDAPLSAAVLSQDSRFLCALENAFGESTVTLKQFKSASKLARKLPDGASAVIWDTASVPLEPEALAHFDEPLIVILVGEVPCPSPETAARVLSLPAPPHERQAARLADFVADIVCAGGRVEDAQARLEESRCELEEAVRLNDRLREQCEFYELQRNRLSETVRRTAYLGQLSKEINCLDIDRIVEICVNKMPKIVDASLVSIYFCDEANKEMVFSKANHPYPLTERVSLDETPQSLMAVAVKRKATLLIRDLDVFQRSLHQPIDRTYNDKYQTPSCIVVPLMSGDRVLAVLNLADKVGGGHFDEVRDLPLVDHISQFIGIALGNCQLYQKVRAQARTDGLTDFVNHNAFFDELNREIERSRRTGGALSLILLDVDNFKLFNDVHGHQVGDKVLKEVARTIRQNVRAVDVPARYGGDEFAVILSATDIKRAEVVAERIRSAVAAKAMTLDGRAFSITVSAGVAQYAPGQNASDIVTNVDEALYTAKSRGRNTVAAESK